MSWHTDNAVKRIFNSFKRLKNQIFEQDIEALKLLNEELINNQKKYVNDNILFLKLLSIHLEVELNHFKDINFAKQNIHKGLNLPLSHHIELLKMKLNEVDLQNYFKSIGVIQKEVGQCTRLEDALNLEIISKEQKGIIEQLDKAWTYDKIEKSMYNTANEFLKDINNYN